MAVTWEEVPVLIGWLLLLGGSMYITGILISKVKDEVEAVMA